MPILIDGNNLMHSLPADSRNRRGVRRLTLDRIRHERIRVFLIFDGPPPEGAAGREELGQLSILYSGTQSADDLIIKRLPKGPAAADWTVITNDRGLTSRAKSAGAKVRNLAQWRQKKAPQRKSRPLPEAKLSHHDIKDWESYFADGAKSDE